MPEKIRIQCILESMNKFLCRGDNNDFISDALALAHKTQTSIRRRHVSNFIQTKRKSLLRGGNSTYEMNPSFISNLKKVPSI